MNYVNALQRTVFHRLQTAAAGQAAGAAGAVQGPAGAGRPLLRGGRGGR